MHPSKRMYQSITTLVLCLTLLVGAFLVVPKVTQAKAPYTPISVSQPSQCAQLVSLEDTQICIMYVSLKQNASKPISFNVSQSGVWCYDKCYKASSNDGVGFALPSGTSLQYASQSIPIVVVSPLSVHGSLTITFVIQGPSNTVKTQLVVANTEG